MKKEWLNPEVKNLNLKNTNEGGIPCPEEPKQTDGLPNWPSDGLICSYPGCTHLVWLCGPNCYCHRNSSLPGGGEALPSKS